MERFEKLAHIAFKPRQVLKLLVVSRVQELATSFFADGLYPAQNIETVLKEVFGTAKSILDPVLCNIYRGQSRRARRHHPGLILLHVHQLQPGW
jgi:hypothetical protein